MIYEFPKTKIEFIEENGTLMVTDLTSKKSFQYLNQEFPIEQNQIEFMLWGFFMTYPEIEAY